MSASALIWLAPIGLVVSLAALAVALTSRRTRRPARSASSDIVTAVREGNTAQAVEHAASRLADLEKTQADMTAAIERLTAKQRVALSHSAVVRFDALNEQTGELSFSLALLDDDRDGVIITSINGRHQTRIYAKAVSGGKSSVALSDEERDALAQAMVAR